MPIALLCLMDNERYSGIRQIFDTNDVYHPRPPFCHVTFRALRALSMYRSREVALQ